MKAQQAIAELSAAGRFNLWLGSGVSHASGESQGFEAMSWMDLCAATLALDSRIPAIVFRFADPLLPRMVAARGMLPPHWNGNGTESGGGDAAPLFFELPGKAAASELWLRRIADAAGEQTPWIAVGVQPTDVADIAAMKFLNSAGSPVYWVQHWNDPPPDDSGFAVNVISGHDAGSFLAALLQKYGEFPPRPVVAPALSPGSDPAEVLGQMLQKAKSFYRDSARRWVDSSETAESIPLLDEHGFEQWLRDERRRAILLTKCGVQNAPLVQAINRMFLARAMGGRRADIVLQWAYEDCRAGSAQYGVQGLHVTKLLIEALRLRARWRKPELAQAIYREGYDAIHAIPASQPIPWEPAMEFAAFLMDWSGTKPVVEAAPLFQEAIQMLERARRGQPRDFEESVLWQQQANHLRTYALRLTCPEANAYFDAARHCVAKVAECNAKSRPLVPGLGPTKGIEQLNLAAIAATQARVDSARESELLAEASRHFMAFIEANPARACVGYSDWGTALSHFADAKFAEESCSLFEKAEAADSQDAILFHNWSAVLLQKARACQDQSEQNHWLAVAEQKALRAFELQRGLGTFNLACISARRSDWERTAYWIEHAGRSSFLPSRAEFESDPDFAVLRHDPRLEVLISRIYPANS